MILKGRLFWKILLGFWLTIVVVSQLLWLGFRAERERPEERLAHQLAAQHLDMVEAMLVQGGIQAATALIDAMPAGTPPLVQMAALGHRDEAQDPGALARIVTAADGQAYLLRARPDPGLLPGGPEPGPLSWLNIPPPMLWIGGVGGLLFSILFAWHLTRPMNALRHSFGLVARGDLGVRLLPALRWRRDELTAVARDFDLMVERLQQLVDGREQLLHDVSHELRSPLARIQMAIGLAEQSPDKVSDSLARIRLETERMDKMIGELLTLSRAQQGHGLEPTHYDLLALVETVLQDARFEAQQSGVQIDLTQDQGEECLLLGHAELVRRAVENVVRNALRFSQPGQRVSVQLARLGHEVQLAIADQGPGVEEGKLACIFDPFVRIGSARAGKGYGLGLAIAHKAVTLQGGSIVARNRSQGGLRVTITLPCLGQSGSI
ncbi:ATP-binding protein [Aeromonas crassostreae]